ncbi:hypothetical protein CHGG_07030 [Chaetomium globosum CBS 148.51]|uniref:Rhodopsin domain-containing protein n=1 Tax=Chaetomium globosum (strain ATCC 6205 / CBS 148.51 / DSM 1962 / NBRC 6347 / NRRL 1970) TaxID=306901 RepID=Q2GYC4_CHAGB|nr:uncharacterized protein CHGG_07030 [Chaetomium globosum CBS 148.51]EAQ85777.1 hypothetical protein CHGG_07030 [Chaetomium globosum CBS 148.51]
MSGEGTGEADDDGFPDRGPVVFAVTTATLALSTVFVAARMVSRVGIVRRTAWDDYMIVLAWLIAVFLSVSIDLGTTHGLGRHDEDIEPDKEAGLRMAEYVFSILYNPALMATKTSILIFYLRLSKNTLKVLRLASWAVLGIVNVAGTILTFMNIFQCHPTDAAWDLSVKAARCIPLLTEFICSAPVNITTDLAILALPIPVLTGMRLPPRQKAILVMTFALGIFVTIVDVVRIYYLQRAIDHIPTTASTDPMASFGRSAGFSWNASLSLMWSAVEVNVGIICACIPTLKPLIIRILPAMLVDPDGTLRSSTRATGTSSSTSTSKDEHQRRGGASIGAMLASTGLAPPAPTLSLTPPAADNDAPTPASASDDISIRDFLSTTTPPIPTTSSSTTTPDLTRRSNSHRSSLHHHHHHHHAPTFITLRRPENLLTTTPRESLRYNAFASILFFLWGFSYGLLNTLNGAVAVVAHISRAQVLSLTAVYFGGGYLLGPLVVGGWLLRHDEHHRTRRGGDGGNGGDRERRRKRARRVSVRRRRGKRAGDESVGGFNATLMVGLLIYGAGTIMFWPGRWWARTVGSWRVLLVVGFGLAVLETAANPFLVLCGPPEYADARLLLAQGVQGVGSVLSGLLADRVFFVGRLEGPAGTVNSTTLIDVQWTYLSVTLLSVLLALLFYYMPLPEVSDAELAELASRSPVDPAQKSIGNISLRTWTVGLAVFAQWCYVSAQENMSLFVEQLITSFTTNPSAALAAPETSLDPSTGLALSLPNYLLIAHTAFALSRFLAGFLCLARAHLSQPHRPSPSHLLRYLPTPRTLLLLCTLTAAVSALTTAAQHSAQKIYKTAQCQTINHVSSKCICMFLHVAGGGRRLSGPFHRGYGAEGSAVGLSSPPGVAGHIVGGGGGDVEGGGGGSSSGGGGGGGEAGGGLSGGGQGQGQGGKGGSLLGERLSPGWPGSRMSLAPDVGPSRRLSSQDRHSQQQQQQQPQEVAPWENQVLDTKILEDLR